MAAAREVVWRVPAWTAAAAQERWLHCSGTCAGVLPGGARSVARHGMRAHRTRTHSHGQVVVVLWGVLSRARSPAWLRPHVCRYVEAHGFAEALRAAAAEAEQRVAQAKARAGVGGGRDGDDLVPQAWAGLVHTSVLARADCGLKRY